jgi:hypothetical protein
MSRRTRKTGRSGLKTRFRTVRDTHGPITRIVGDGPLLSLDEAAKARLAADAPAWAEVEGQTRGDRAALAAIAAEPEDTPASVTAKAKAARTVAEMYLAMRRGARGR